MYKKKLITSIIIILLILITIIISNSYGYEMNDLKIGDILIGDDIYNGYISPNQIINSSINYYINSKDEEPIKLYKYNGKELLEDEVEHKWLFLQNNNKYAELSEDGVNKLEVRRYVNKASEELKKMSDEELEENSSLKYNGGYYFFEVDLQKLNIKSTKEITGYLVFKDGEVVEYNFDIGIKRYDILEKDYDELEVVEISRFGAIGDGVTDDTKAIQKAVDYVNENGGKLLFDENKTYLISLSDPPGGGLSTVVNGTAAITFDTTQNIEIDLNKSTLQLKANGLLRYCMIIIKSSGNIIIHNGKIVGDRLEHDYSTQYAPYSAYSYGILINSQSSIEKYKVILKDLEISSMTGDGIVTANMKMDINGQQKTRGLIIIDNVDINRNRRQGITIGDTDKVIIKNTYIHDIGSLPEKEMNEVEKYHYDSKGNKFSKRDLGLNPQSGIDIEPGNTTNDIILNNIKIENTSGYSLVSGKKEYTNNIRIYNSSILGDYNFYNALIYNTYFNITNSVGNGLHYCTVYNSEFYNKIQDRTVAFSDYTKIYSSKISSDISYNAILALKNSYLYNSHIEGFNQVSLTSNYENEMVEDYNNLYINNKKINLTNSNINSSKISGTENDKTSISIRNSKISNTKINYASILYEYYWSQTQYDANGKKINVIKDSKFEGYNNEYNNTSTTIWTFTQSDNKVYSDKDSTYNNSTITLTNLSTSKQTLAKLSDLNLNNTTIKKKYYLSTLEMNNMNLQNVTITHYLDTTTFTNININSNSKINNLNFLTEPKNYNKYSSIILDSTDINGINTDVKIPITLKNKSTFSIADVKDNLIINDKFLCDDSIIEVKGNLLNKEVFKNSKFSNFCQINLDIYNDNNKLDIVNGVLNKDYKVNYNGKNVLN